MAALGREANTCFGRGFDAGGFAGKLKAWIVKTASNHGPLWYILYDNSSAGTDPYIVITDQASPTANSLAKIIQVKLPTATAGRIEFHYWNWFDTTIPAGVGPFGSPWFTSYLSTVDSGIFSYDFRGGPEFVSFGTLVGQSHVIDFAMIDEISYISDDYCKDVTSIGTLSAAVFADTDSGNQIGGYENITGAFANLDAAGKIYFSLVNTAGTTYRIDIYKDSARTLLIGHTATFTNTATGTKSITADNSSGLGGTVTLTATATASTSISCPMNRVAVGTGEGANFAALDWVYLTDFSLGTSAKVNYVQIASISSDVLILASVPSAPFSAGAKVGAYPHRFFVLAPQGGSDSAYYPALPYQSYSLLEFGSSGQSVGGQLLSRRTDLTWLLSNQQPNDKIKYAGFRPLVRELYHTGQNSTGMNREYGQAKNIMMGSSNSMSLYLNGRAISGKEWLYVLNFSSISVGLTGALMISHKEALS